jgi:antitoxin ParD1/3/4
MPTTKKRSISLAIEQMNFIDAKVKGGEYASASEVIRAGLRALKERDEAVQRWHDAQVAVQQASGSEGAAE